MRRESPVNASRRRLGRVYGARMRTARLKEDSELLTLFEQSGRNVERASCLLRDLFAEYPEHPELAAEVRDCEHEGDRIAHAILSRLAARGASLEAADVHALTGALDDVVDYAEEAADQLGLYGVEAPMDQAQRMADVLVLASGEVAGALRGLRDGEELGERLVEIHRLEDHADRIVRAAVASLFVSGCRSGAAGRAQAGAGAVESII
jgi:uncharacterized protein